MGVAGSSGTAGLPASGGIGGVTSTGGVANTGGVVNTGGVPPKPFCPPDCPMPTLVATGFETAPLLGTTRPSLYPYTVEVVHDIVHNGTSAMHFVQNTQQAQVGKDYIFPAVSGASIYVRAYVYIPPGTVTQGCKIVDFARTNALGTDINVEPNGAVNFFVHTATTYVDSANLSYPQGRWFCLQADMFVSHTDGSVHVAIDGNPVVAVTGKDTEPAGGVNLVGIGALWTYRNQTNMEVYFDDVVIAKQPIPCE